MVTKKIPQLKQSSSSQPSDVSPADLLHVYCKDIENWPARWEIVKEDLTIGWAITEQFKLFLLDRIKKGRAKKTVKNYADFLWVLGGELIRSINENEDERQLSANDLILKYIDDSGGPYWRHANDEAGHARYDSVCKQLFKFMTTYPN
jgi:hypothetical protein